MLKNLWNDEVGALLSAEFILLATILVIGAIVGLKAVQEAVVTELADVGGAIGKINQGYSYLGSTGHASATAGSVFDDAADFCDLANAGGSNSKCVVVNTPAPAAE
jgi:hypothetical protein